MPQPHQRQHLFSSSGNAVLKHGVVHTYDSAPALGETLDSVELGKVLIHNTDFFRSWKSN